MSTRHRRAPRQRYYAQHFDVPPWFLPPDACRGGFTGWIIFDRDWMSREGESKGIALAINRREAWRIRDGLNMLEEAEATARAVDRRKAEGV